MTSHTEEEEMNQRRHLLAQARKGVQKAINQLMDLYQVRVYSGDSVKSLRIRHTLPTSGASKPKPVRTLTRTRVKQGKGQGKGTSSRLMSDGHRLPERRKRHSPGSTSK